MYTYSRVLLIFILFIIERATGKILCCSHLVRQEQSFHQLSLHQVRVCRSPLVNRAQTNTFRNVKRKYWTKIKKFSVAWKFYKCESFYTKEEGESFSSPKRLRCHQSGGSWFRALPDFQMGGRGFSEDIKQVNERGGIEGIGVTRNSLESHC